MSELPPLDYEAEGVTHFVDVAVCDDSIEALVMARVLGVVHGVIKNEKTSLRVMWPEMVRGIRFGSICRVFGRQEDLATFVRGLSPLTERKLVRSFGPMKSYMSDKWVVAQRSRAREKEVKGIKPEFRKAMNPGGFKVKPLFLIVGSESNGQRYSLFIEQHVGGEPFIGGAGYGLGMRCPLF